MNQKKAKAIRKFLGKKIPQVSSVLDGEKQVMFRGKLTTIQNWIPGELSEEENATKAEYRRLKKMYKNGELPL